MPTINDLRDALSDFDPQTPPLEHFLRKMPDDPLASVKLVGSARPASETTHSRRPTRRNTPRRSLIGFGVAAATVAAAALVLSAALPAGSPGGASPAAAAELDRLAATALAGPSGVLQPGQFAHVVEVTIEDGTGNAPEAEPANGSGPAKQQAPKVSRTTAETWTAYDGTTWSMEHHSYKESADYHEYPAGGADLNRPSPKFLTTLPTEAGALNTYMREHVQGSTSTDEAVFVAVGDILRGGYAPATLRAAAIGVLKLTPHVTLGTAKSDSLGRPAIEFDFVDNAGRPGQTQSLSFDPSTAELIQEAGTGYGYVSVVQTTDTTDAVPAEVVRDAVLVHTD